MNQILYEFRCKCKEEFLITKKQKKTKKRKPRRRRNLLKYPDSTEGNCRTFIFNSEQKLSSNAKLLLNSFQKKYLYHAIDDILYLPNLSYSEQEYLLALLYSPALVLQNHLFVDFFNVWIYEIYVDKIIKKNRFFRNNFLHSSELSQITIKLVYKLTVPTEKPKSYW